MHRHSENGSHTNSLAPESTDSASNGYYKTYEEHRRASLDYRKDSSQGRGSMDPKGEDLHVDGGVNRRNQSWPYVDYSETSETTQSFHTSQSYNDFGVSNSSASGSYVVVPQKPQIHSAPSSTAGRNERRIRRKRMGNSSDETSGYSTNNSISELSELTPINHPKNRTKSVSSQEYHHREQVDFGGTRDSSHNLHFKNRERLSGRMGTPMRAAVTSKKSDYSLSGQRIGKRSESNLSVNTNSDISRNSREKVEKTPVKSEGQSKRSSTHSLDSKHPIVPRNGSIGVTVTTVQYDPNDPFAFIQTVKLPLHVRVRKCLCPIIALLLVLIVAASLGAAIYFASALKETQEKQIEFLRANLVMKIRNAGDIQNLEELSQEDFESLSSSYCRRMDDFYGNSQFSVSYRGCEVISIKNQQINFTLFFVERDASSRDIMSVIEKSAPKIEEKDAQLAQVDTLQVELDSVKVNIDTRREPETFNKKSPDAIRTTTPITHTGATKTLFTASAASSSKSSFITTEIPKFTKTFREQNIVTMKPATSKEVLRKKSTPSNKPVYSWDPCIEYEGTYFPHPVRCDWFFQCNHNITLLQKCTSDLVYDWKSLSCVSKFTRGIKCPDASMAPKMPQTEAATTTKETTPPAAVTFTFKSTTTVDERSITVPRTPGPQIQNIPEKIDPNLSAVAGKYSGRGDIKADPCTSTQDGNLYAHPTDCAKFIQCVNGNAHEMGCAPGLVFEPASNVCILPKNDLICPDIHPCKGHNDGYFPHPYNCSLFIQCQHNAEKIISCRPGLVWNTTVKSCVLKTKGMKCDSEES